MTTRIAQHQLRKCLSRFQRTSLTARERRDASAFAQATSRRRCRGISRWFHVKRGPAQARVASPVMRPRQHGRLRDAPVSRPNVGVASRVEGGTRGDEDQQTRQIAPRHDVPEGLRSSCALQALVRAAQGRPECGPPLSWSRKARKGENDPCEQLGVTGLTAAFPAFRRTRHNATREAGGVRDLVRPAFGARRTRSENRCKGLLYTQVTALSPNAKSPAVVMCASIPASAQGAISSDFEEFAEFLISLPISHKPPRDPLCDGFNSPHALNARVPNDGGSPVAASTQLHEVSRIATHGVFGFGLPERSVRGRLVANR